MTKFEQCNIFNLKMQRTRAHDGMGNVLFKRIAERNHLSSRVNFIDFTIMPPGTTIGEHTHGDREEEFYLVLSGVGRMRCNGKEFEVTAGDLIRNPPGGTHGLDNVGSDQLQLFVFEIAVEDHETE